jgi:hypothetical protein
VANQQSSRGRAQDRAKVSGGQQHEVRYEAHKQRVSENEAKRTIDQVGNSRRTVEAKLAGKRS